jgi:hypothetical protein
VLQASSNYTGSQNFSFLALDTAELASIQISFKNRRQRRVTEGICFFTQINFFAIKSHKRENKPKKIKIKLQVAILAGKQPKLTEKLGNSAFN